MEGSLPKSNILVVDDTPANLGLLSGMLTAAGYKVRPAPSGRLALRAAQSDPPDLILLDINMPEMNGFEVCRALKEDDLLKSIPVLFISALTETEDKIAAFQAGGLDYITKPFQAEEVLARVATHVKIRQYQNELKEKNEALKQTLQELKAAQNHLVQSEKMASLGVLTAGIAHEINNPINFIKSSALALNRDLSDILKLLKANEECSSNCQDPVIQDRIVRIKEEIDYTVLLPELTSLVDKIQLGVNRTEEIVNSLRTYARTDSEKKTPTDISALIDSTLVLLKNRYHGAVTLTKHYGKLPLIPVQPGRLAQVFSNVINNSIDAVSGSPQKATPTIEIGTGLDTIDGITYAAVRICDNGSGMSNDHLAKIFDPFFTTKEVGKGTGLGMSISYGIIRDHNGHINISSSETTGTTVVIILPLQEIQS